VTEVGRAEEKVLYENGAKVIAALGSDGTMSPRNWNFRKGSHGLTEVDRGN
jgi:hypothetical protein